jgi:hypothetical protein
MRSRWNWEPAAAFVVNQLTSDPPLANLYLRTGYFLLLYEGTGCPKTASAAREFSLPLIKFIGRIERDFRDLRAMSREAFGNR